MFYLVCNLHNRSYVFILYRKKIKVKKIRRYFMFYSKYCSLLTTTFLHFPAAYGYRIMWSPAQTGYVPSRGASANRKEECLMVVSAGGVGPPYLVFPNRFRWNWSSISSSELVFPRVLDSMSSIVFDREPSNGFFQFEQLIIHDTLSWSHQMHNMRFFMNICLVDRCRSLTTWIPFSLG